MYRYVFAAYILHQKGVCFCLVLSDAASVPWQIYFASQLISMKFTGDNDTMSRSNDNILLKIGAGTKEQDTRENFSRRLSVLL